MEEQTHPLYSTDREIIDRMLSKKSPNESDFVDLARLNLRYGGFPGATDLKDDIKKILNFWGLSIKELNQKSKEIWKSGFRPGERGFDDVGSGFDTSDNS
tara:strand:+ start:2265 stop:2564 length:300 start_codon:yes stop_codon:yes gene_type:complete